MTPEFIRPPASKIVLILSLAGLLYIALSVAGYLWVQGQ